MSELTPADMAAVSGSKCDGLFGGEGLWLFAILALMWGGNGFFGRNNQPSDYARQSDVVYTSAFNQLQDENGQIRAEIQRVGYEAMGTTKDTAYNTLSEIRDLEAAVNAGFANQQKCCCEIQKEILSNRYEAAINTASINANAAANTQKILDTLAANRMADMQNQINQLQLQVAMSGVVRYPMAATYSSPAPFGPGACNSGTTLV